MDDLIAGVDTIEQGFHLHVQGKRICNVKREC